MFGWLMKGNKMLSMTRPAPLPMKQKDRLLEEIAEKILDSDCDPVSAVLYLLAQAQKKRQD
jgi:hypothetical protein